MKKIEQAAIEHCNNEINEGSDNDALFSSRLGMKQLCNRTFKSGVEFAQRWIPVEEELPEFKTYVLCKRTSMSMSGVNEITPSIGWLNTNNRFSCEMDLVKVTHWRPINYK